MSANFDYLERLKKVECSDSTYPSPEAPLIFDRAEGSTIYDVEGRSYIDLCGGFGVMSLGHHYPEHKKVFAEFAASKSSGLMHGMGDVYASRHKVEFIEKLLSTLPEHINRAALSITGSGAVEIALKTALLRKPSGKIVSFEKAYHGVDLGILPLVDRSDFKDPFASWLPSEKVVRLPYNAPQKVIAACFEKEADIAAIIVEPIQGRGGIVLPYKGWLESLRSFADQSSALLIFDEIFTGLGRIGVMSSSEQVKADLICLGKSLGGGLPLSACCGSSEAFSSWPESKGEAIHTGTFFGHPLSCQLGKVQLEALTNYNYPQKNKEKGQSYLDLLIEKLSDLDAVKEIRGEGLMLGIEFHKQGHGAFAMDELRKSGVIALASGSLGEVLSLTPAFNISDKLFESAVEKLRSILV